MPEYIVIDPGDNPLKWKDIPIAMRESQQLDALASFKSKTKAKLIRNYMGGGKKLSVLCGFRVSKNKSV